MITRKKLDNVPEINKLDFIMVSLPPKLRILFAGAVLALCVCTGAHAVEYTTVDFIGKWRLTYGGGFGYEFYFKENYRAYVVIFLKSHVLVFRGIYAVDEGNIIRINISDMKEQPTGRSYESEAGFTKTSSSVFLFSVSGMENRKLVIRPRKIQIDGRRSDGYFEEEIPLTFSN
ncbi:MAG: hypothetical protein ACOC2H_07105 [Spirochaetota bacterium]